MGERSDCEADLLLEDSCIKISNAEPRSECRCACPWSGVPV
jgi:hypothetical protein